MGRGGRLVLIGAEFALRALNTISARLHAEWRLGRRPPSGGDGSNPTAFGSMRAQGVRCQRAFFIGNAVGVLCLAPQIKKRPALH